MTVHHHSRICRWIVLNDTAVCTAEGQRPVAVPVPVASKRWFRR